MKEKKLKPKTGKSGVDQSRRGFLRGTGLVTAGTVLLQNPAQAIESWTSVRRGTTLGPDAVPIQFKVNGQSVTILAEPRTTLANALRYQLELTGTKIGCDRGSCSACTVYLDGKPVNSCMTLAMDAVNREVTTIEGIAADGELHPVQEAFIEHDATQCGYCTPGMVMSCVHLVEHKKDLVLEDVKMATRGNLCRCGTYPHVFKATLAAAEKMKK